MSKYAEIMHLLRRNQIVRSFNNPVADVAEWLVCNKLNLRLAPKSSKGYDAVDQTGKTKYQIKARWLATARSSKQLSALRDLNSSSPPFDYLIAVMFNDDFYVDYAAQMPIAYVFNNSKPVERTNSHRFNFTQSMLSAPGVMDHTETLRVFPPSTEMERRIVAASRTTC